MRYRRSVVAVAVLLCLSVAASAQDAKRYSAWEGTWGRGSPPGSWDPTKPPGLGQQAPLTPEYQAVYEANLAKAKAGIAFDPKYTCGPVGMPRVMALGTMEFIVKPTVVYMLLELTSPLRRIYTDGRAWPKEPDPSYVGYSIGKWHDADNDGNPGTFEIETRALKGLRLMDNSGIPLARDGEPSCRKSCISTKPTPTSCTPRSPPSIMPSRSHGGCRGSTSACMTPGRRKIIAPRKTA